MHDQGTARIPLRARDGSVRAYAIVDGADADFAHQWRWHLADGYAVRNGRTVDGTRFKIYLHRELLGLSYRDRREGDHRDRNPLNNSRANLRVTSHAGNRQNVDAYRGAASKYRGVSWHKGTRRWQARVQVNGMSRFVGRFSNELDAAEAARAARLELMPLSTD